MRPVSPAFLYVLAVIGAASALLVSAYTTISWELFPQMALFIVLIAVASFLIIHDPSGGVISSTGTLFYIVIYVFDPVTAFVIAGLGYSIGNTLPRSWVTWRACLNAAQMGLSAFLGSLAYRAVGGDLLGPSVSAQLVPAFVGPLVHQIANNFFVAYLISQLRSIRFLRTWMNFIRELLWSNLLSIPTAILIAMLYLRVNHAFIVLFLVSLPFQRWALRLYLEKRNTYARIIEQLVRAGELSLPGTRGHAQRVAALSVKLARQIGLTERDVEAIEYAALLHDIGMIGLEAIESVEWVETSGELAETHVQLGAEVVSELGRPDIVEMVLHHHTSFGSAPKTSGKKAKDYRVSLGARILALAEEVDSRLHALFPYSDPQPFRSVLQYVEDSRGILFDPQVVDAFLQVMHKKELTMDLGSDIRTEAVRG